MNTQPDFEELLRLLEQNKVQYMIIGGYAVAFHGYPRFTKDIDIFYLNSRENIEKLINALISFGFPKSQLPAALFNENGNIIQFGMAPVRIDLLNEIDGINFKEAEKNIQRGKYGTVEVSFIGKPELLINKKESGRPQDQADVAMLKEKKEK